MSNLASTVHAGLATLVVLLFVLLLLAVWLCYAYFFPHTWSGQMLIKVNTYIPYMLMTPVINLCFPLFQYRPTRWHWLRNEPRYTAASIHM